MFCFHLQLTATTTTARSCQTPVPRKSPLTSFRQYTISTAIIAGGRYLPSICTGLGSVLFPLNIRNGSARNKTVIHALIKIIPIICHVLICPHLPLCPQNNRAGIYLCPNPHSPSYSCHGSPHASSQAGCPIRSKAQAT